MKRKLLALSLAIWLAVSVGGCSQAQEKYSDSFDSMDTLMQLTVYGDKGALEDIRDRIEELDSILSATDKNSDICALNSAGAATVDSAASELLMKANELSRKTGGALDVTVYPIVEEWGFISGDHKIPSKERLAELVKSVGFSGVKIQGESVALPKGAKVGLGAVAKGYAADEAELILEKSDSKGAILNLGGTVVAYGSKNGESWKVGVADPENSAGYMGYLTCKDKIIATSGKYERYFKGDDGKIYGHIIDPKTGIPVDNGLRSVTVISDSGVTADGLSTALFVMGREKAEEYYRSHKNFDFIILTDDNNAYVSEGVADSFKLEEGHEYTVKTVK